MNRDCKDVIAFDPADYLAVVEKLQLDLHEPPMSQVRTFTLVLLYVLVVLFDKVL